MTAQPRAFGPATNFLWGKDDPMGLFGDDQLQDERLNALEAHIRVLTEIQQQNQLDITENNILLIEAHGMIAALQFRASGALGDMAVKGCGAA